MKLTSRDAAVASIFEKGLQAHNAGDLSSAEQLYQEILAIQPDHCEANHNIGMVLAAKNDLDKALKFFKYALDTSPNVSLFWASYIDVLIKLDRITESKTLIKAVKDAGIHSEKIETISKLLSVEYQDPGPKDAQKLTELIEAQKFDDAIKTCLNLMDTYPSSAVLNINLGKCYFELGQIEPAIASYKIATEYQPKWAASFIMLGQLYSSQEDPEQAVNYFKKAIDLQPGDTDLLAALGAELLKNESFEQAIDYLNTSIRQNPNSSFILSMLGDAHNSKADHKSAIGYYEQAIALDPTDATTHFNMGNALQALGNSTAAIESYQKALNINPVDADAYNNVGISLRELGRLEEAIDSCTNAIKIKPNYPAAYNNIGLILQDQGNLRIANEFYNIANKITPNYAEGYCNMGLFLRDRGDQISAIEFYNMAIKINPSYAAARAHKLYQQAYNCDWVKIEEERHLIPSLGTLKQETSPFSMLVMEDAPLHHRLRSENFTKKSWPQEPLKLAIKPKHKPNRLRIGYFSADFHNHATMYLMAKIFETHDRERFEIYAYSFGPHRDDEMRHRLTDAVDVFTDVRMKGDKDVALLAQKNKLDIAVDLKGYTGGSRFGIFAYRAAPIQISYLGYPGTSGAEVIDYLVADKVVITKQLESSYSESIIRLPNSYQATDNTRVISNRTITKSEMGLPEEGFVFCCFNSNYKISSVEFKIWMRLLKKVNGSVLWLFKSNQLAEDNLRSEAEAQGILSERLIFAKPVPHAEHLTRHRLADLFIDTFNVNAHTTASDALWAGLPIVTKLGKGFAARVAGSLLTAIHLPELITVTEQEYEKLILELATNPKRLSAIKQKLAANRLSTPLFNSELFTKHLEDGYEQAYDRYFVGKNTDTINVLD